MLYSIISLCIILTSLTKQNYTHINNINLRLVLLPIIFVNADLRVDLNLTHRINSAHRQLNVVELHILACDEYKARIEEKGELRAVS